MADPLITIPVDLDSKQVDAGLDKIKGKADRAGRESADRFKKPFSGDIFSSLSKQLLGLAATVSAGLSFKKSIEAAIVQQNAVNNLNRSLAQAGEFSRAASQDFQNFASSLQNVTTFGDEVILDQIAIAKSFGLTNQQAKNLVQGATELSAVFGTSLESNVKNLGKTYSGLTGELGESLPLIRSLTAEQLKSGDAIELVLSKFGGAATAQLNTFQGQLQRTANSFGDFLETSGAAFTSSPQLIAVIKTIGDEFAKLAKNASSVDVNSILSTDNIIAFGRAINEFVIAPLELVFNFAKIIFNGINTVISGSVALIGQKVGFIGDLLNKIGVDNGLTQAFQNFRESSAEVFTGVALDTQQAVDGLFNGTLFGKGEEFLGNLAVNLEQAKAQIESSGIQNSLNVAPQQGPSFIDSFVEGFARAEITLKNFAEKSKAFGQQIRANLQAGIANGAGQAFAQFGTALATGQNALDAFAKAFIGSIGQIAIQQGASFILQGIAYSFVPGFQATGAGLIGAGAALATLGGALTAFAGKGGSGASAATGGASGGSSIAGEQIFDPRTSLPAASERVDPSTAVTVNIQGDVFDSEETGLRISNILRDASLNQNVRASVFA